MLRYDEDFQLFPMDDQLVRCREWARRGVRESQLLPDVGDFR